MLALGYYLASFPIDAVPENPMASVFRLTQISHSIPRVVDFESYIENQEIDRLIYFANNLCCHYKPWPCCLQYKKEPIVDNLSERSMTFYKGVAAGLEMFFKNKVIENVEFYSPQITFSERFQSFSLTYYYCITYCTGKIFFNVLHYVPDDKYSKYSEVSEYIERVHMGATRQILADNNCYALKYNGGRYKSGFTTLYNESSFIKDNFDLVLDLSMHRFTTVTLGGMPQGANNKKVIKNSISAYVALTENNVSCTVNCKKWNEKFNYADYSLACFHVIGYYSVIRDLLSEYTSVNTKTPESGRDKMVIKSLEEILAQLIGKGVKFNAITMDEVKLARKKVTNESLDAVASAGGTFFGSAVGAILPK